MTRADFAINYAFYSKRFSAKNLDIFIYTYIHNNNNNLTNEKQNETPKEKTDREQ